MKTMGRPEPYPDGVDLYREWCWKYGRERGREITRDYLECQKVNEERGGISEGERKLCHTLEVMLETC